jgi:hypothetical protein
MPQLIELGALSFPTKKACTEHFKAILYRHALGIRIPDPDATELGWLLERHPEYGQKVGCGIDHFITHKNNEFPTIGFYLIRKDGSGTDFSYLKCVNGKENTPMQEAVRAMRAEIQPDIRQAKLKYFQENADADGKVACAITGILVSIDEAHADHAPPRTFHNLALLFLAAKGIDPDWTFVTPSTDNQYQPRMMDVVLAGEWRVYHHKMQVMRIVAKHKNLSLSHESKVKKRDKQLKLSV